MEPAERQDTQPDREQGAAAENGAQAPQGAAEPLLSPPDSGPPPQPGETAELEALRLARLANETAGGLIARLDQLETKVLRVDRQLLVLIGMVAVLTWSVKSLAGKVGADGAAAATPS
jgi:hypothetical protein